MAEIISGKTIGQEIRSELSQRIDALKKKNIQPGLGVILAGDNPGSQIYVRMKEKDCREIGIYTETKRFPDSVDEDTVLKAIQTYNDDPNIHGILVQLPLPKGVSESAALNAVDPKKDVDGFHPFNTGKLLIGEDTFVPCTPLGVLEMLHRSGNPPGGKHVVIIGRSNIVGKPLAALLMQKNDRANATVTLCHSRTADLPAVTGQADILIAAIGVPEFVTANMVRAGAVVIDVGTNRVDDPAKEKGYRLVGDVTFDEVSEKAAAISPSPGGVGPMTRTMLLFNTVTAAENM